MSALNQGKDTTFECKSPFGLFTESSVPSSEKSISTIANPIFFFSLGEKKALDNLPTFLSLLFTCQKFSGALVIGSPSNSNPTNF